MSQAPPRHRVILHIDVDAFFVSAELTLRPELKNQAVAISSGGANAVVTALSYRAKQRGARVPMKLRIVRHLCPDVVVLKPNLALYSRLANQIYQHLRRRYTRRIEIGSIDEWFLDVSWLWKAYGGVYQLGQTIQTDLLQTFGLEVSIGISQTKFLAKMATGLHKPFGITIMRPADIASTIWPLAIERYWGIGPRRAGALRAAGITTIGALARCSATNQQLRAIFKERTAVVLAQARGQDQEPIRPASNELTLVANSLTFSGGPEQNFASVCQLLRAVCQLVAARLHERCLVGTRMGLNLKLAGGRTISASHHLNHPVAAEAALYNQGLRLLEQLWTDQAIIGVGVSLGNLRSQYRGLVPLRLFDPPAPNVVQTIINHINHKMGQLVVVSLREYQDNRALRAGQSKYIK